MPLRSSWKRSSVRRTSSSG